MRAAATSRGLQGGPPVGGSRNATASVPMVRAPSISEATGRWEAGDALGGGRRAARQFANSEDAITQLEALFAAGLVPSTGCETALARQPGTTVRAVPSAIRAECPAEKAQELLLLIRRQPLQ